MVIKPTLRQNGQKMFSVFQELHVSRYNLINSTCRVLSDTYDGDIDAMKAAELSRTRIMKEALQDLLQEGYEWYPEGYGYEHLMDDAEAYVDALFPDFK
jgi:hypothetical protein